MSARSQPELEWVHHVRNRPLVGATLLAKEENAVRLREKLKAVAKTRPVVITEDFSRWERFKNWFADRAKGDKLVRLTPVSHGVWEAGPTELGASPATGWTDWVFKDPSYPKAVGPGRLTMALKGYYSTREGGAGGEAQVGLPLPLPHIPLVTRLIARMKTRINHRVLTMDDPKLKCSLVLPWGEGDASLRRLLEAVVAEINPEVDPHREVEELWLEFRLPRVEPDGWHFEVDPICRELDLPAGSNDLVSVNITPGDAARIPYLLRLEDSDGGVVVSELIEVEVPVGSEPTKSGYRHPSFEGDHAPQRYAAGSRTSYHNIVCTINGRTYENTVEARLLLVHYLRDTLGLTGTHIGCDTSQCGACTIHVDGLSVKSCTMFAVQANGRDLTTIEGMAKANGELHPLQQAFWEEHGLQCGYCTPGFIMAAADLLQHNPNPTEQEIRRGLEGNLCRCTGYVNIVKAVQLASKLMKSAGDVHAAAGAGRRYSS